MISRGEEWGSAPGGPAELIVAGGDRDLAAAVLDSRSPRVGFSPDGTSDLARAVGLAVGPAADDPQREVPMDTLRLADGRLAVNVVVLGVPPDQVRPWHRRTAVAFEIDGRQETAPAFCVALFTGQYLRGYDVNPRSHPGDGVLELQAYGPAAGQRKAMRARLAHGAHLPHPQIVLRRGRRATVRVERPWPLEIDGHHAGSATEIEVCVVAGAYRLLV